MNKVILMGNLTRDVDLKNYGTSTVARVGIAVHRRYKDKDAVDFFNLVAWDKTAEFCGRYLVKGSRILVEGRLQTSTYEKDGVKHTVTDIIIEQVEFADSKKSNGARDKDFGGEPVDDGDMPF